MNEERILENLLPPAGGWQRLVARRDAAPSWRRLGVPLAMAATLAMVVMLIRPQPAELDVPWSGGRLVAQPSAGAGLHRVADADATALPTDDPQVRLYWLQKADSQ
jgi:hypothetical protein